ncbi:MAG: ABC transporter ATP-binding protein/permease [Chloroherpetonaceae bacterium]|nr:ABC transporter ATP-binding protein/permease [Chloroherpetonaceae bacterium]MDW8437453.1 ABC transporter ATP-binding protein [Chloroherpetonaceae bacterium]
MKSLASLNKYLWRYRYRLAFGALWLSLTNFCLVYAPKFIGQAIDAMKGEFAMRDVLREIGLAVLFSALGGFFLFCVRQTIVVASRKIEFELKNDFYAHLQTLSQNFFKSSSTGDLMSRATNDLNAVRNYLGPGIMYSLNAAFRLVFALSAMAAMSPELTLVAMSPAPLIVYGVYRIGKIIHERSQDLQERYARITTKVQENLAGIRVVKAYVREESEIESFFKLNQDYYDKNLALAKRQAIFNPAMSGLLGLSVILTLWVGGEMAIEGKMTIGEIAQFLIYVGSLSWPLVSIGWVTNIVQRAAAAQARIDEIMTLEPEIKDDETVNRAITNIAGAIEFRDVSFAYPSRPNDWILKNVSFKLERGMKLAIVGATGAGKSTLVHLIPRLIDATSGEIFIDGVPIREIPLQVLRNAIGFVPQDHFLFSDSIRNNIAFGVADATEAEVVEAAKLACLDDDIQAFPARYDTMIGERGITLSGGQKQRAAIARALIRKPAILVLDDALSAVDAKTEDAILRNLSVATRHMTVILITHRVSVTLNADLILVMERGEIVERGSPAELLARNGRYAELHRKQALEEELSALE